jgi:hypothetical protein
LGFEVQAVSVGIHRQVGVLSAESIADVVLSIRTVL